MLHAGDYKNSHIQYNLGLFLYDKKTLRYVVDKRLDKKLFSLAPSTNVNGLFVRDQFDYSSPMNDHDLDTTGIPATRFLKEDFFNRLGNSLILDPTLPLKDFVREYTCLEHIKKTLMDHPAFHSSPTEAPVTVNNIESTNEEIGFGGHTDDNAYATLSSPESPPPMNDDVRRSKRDNVSFPSNLLGKYYSDLNIFNFGEFSFLDTISNHAFMSGLFYTSGFINSVEYYEDLLKMVMHMPTNTPAKDENGRRQLPRFNAMGTSRIPNKFERHLKNLEKRCKGSKSPISLSKSEFRKIMKKIKVVAGSEVSGGTGICLNPNDYVNEYMEGGKIDDEDDDFTPFVGLYITFGRRMASFLNADANQSILIGKYGFPTMNPEDYYLKLSPDFNKKKIQHVQIYSDLVAPVVRVGGSLLNLLDIVSTDSQNIIHRPYAKTQYRPLRNNTIESVSMIITDTEGKDIRFEDPRASASFELHIRPVKHGL